MTAVSTPARAARRAAPRRRALPPDAVRRGALALIVLGALGVLALWWADTPRVAGAADWLTNAGRITGLLAGYAAPVLLLLMARVPLLEREVGADRLARWHAYGGRYLVSLVTVHVLTVIWGYALTDGHGLWDQGVEMVFHFPDMLKATFATLLLLGTGAVSARAARRRMGYEVWYYLHLATYLAVALGFAHQLTTGADLTDGPAKAGWYLLYFGTAAVLGWYRLLSPYLRDRRHRLEIAEVRAEGPGVVSVFLTGRHLDELRAEPGQFFRLQFLTPAALGRQPVLALRSPAPALPALHRQGPGRPQRGARRARPRHQGPRRGAVRGVHRAAAPRRAGAAARRGRRRHPLRALVETLPGRLTLVQRARRPEDVLFRRELAAVSAQRGVRVHELLGGRAEVGDLGAALRRLVPDLARHEVYLCGPEEFTADAVRALRAAGVRADRIHHESFAF
ncbi:ferric reductase-like transmembrane domain-containing protein [Kitasatospora saccharophila]|uniref:ferric reductase-like transmembrane domain-containing protein n=1 Tax=Kitasatospora saccharophila TaxID=407973 RepID=UPI003639BFF2